VSTETTERVDDIEARMAFLERTVQELDDVVREAFDEIARLKGEVNKLSDRLEQGPELGVHVGSPQDEVPPHY
jgi:uncharacterized coiled-coil protein SlyX